MSIQISHLRLGLIRLWPLYEEDHPKTSLSLKGAYEVNIFGGKIGMLEYNTIDSPLFVFDYALIPAVILRKQHANSGMKLLVMTKGSMALHFNDTQKEYLSTGKFYLFQQDDYSIALQENCKVQYLLYNINELSQRMNWELFPEGRYEMNVKMQVRLSDIMKPPEMIASPNNWLSIEMANFLYQMWEIQSRHANGSELLDYVFAAERYIREHFTKDLNNEQIAAHVGISHSTLKEPFEDYFKMTMARYQIHLRIEYAMQLLKYTNKSIKEIYIACGYTRESTFRENFKEVTKLNPNTWRQIHKA